MNIQHEVPEEARAATPTAANLASSLREMLEVYWGDGDGDPAPEFIQHAQRLLVAFDRAAG